MSRRMIDEKELKAQIEANALQAGKNVVIENNKINVPEATATNAGVVPKFPTDQNYYILSTGYTHELQWNKFGFFSGTNGNVYIKVKAGTYSANTELGKAEYTTFLTPNKLATGVSIDYTSKYASYYIQGVRAQSDTTTRGKIVIHLIATKDITLDKDTEIRIDFTFIYQSIS